MTDAHWHAHPGVRSGDDRTLGERAADGMRAGMGSWGFVFGALGFLGVWMVFNGHGGFDPYPFILLNLVLSCLAALQGAILLIAAKRADNIAAQVATHTAENTDLTLQLLRQNTLLTEQVRTLAQALHDHITGKP